MENYSKINIILKYGSDSIEILLPNNYDDLFKIFIEKFKIEKSKEDSLTITYIDDENDNIIIFSDEDFEVFKNLLKENLIKNELIGTCSNNSLQSIGNIFNIELEHLIKNINNNNIQNHKTIIENSYNSLEDSDNDEKETEEILIKNNNKSEEEIDSQKTIKENNKSGEEEIYSQKIIEDINKSGEEQIDIQKTIKEINQSNSEINNKESSEIKMLMEENKKQNSKLEELERKMNEQKENYESQISQINLENQMLKEKNKKNETKLDEYSQIVFEKEKLYNKFKECYEKKKNEDDNYIKLLEEKTILLNKKVEEKNKIINEFINKNKALINNIKEKENKIKEYKMNQKTEEVKFNQLIKKNKIYCDQIGKMKKELEEYKNKINEINDNDNNDTNDNNRILIQKFFDKQSEEYKNILKCIKMEYNIELNKIIKEILKTNFDNNIYNEINKQSDIIFNNYLRNLEDFEKESKNNFSKIMNNKNKILNVCINETIHEGVKCQNCLMKPIIGERYKCSICPDYNLCKECEEDNSNTLKHKHNFIKIRYVNIENINNNNIDIKKLINNNNIDIKKSINMNYFNDITCINHKNNNEKYSFIIKNIQKIYLIYCETKKYVINLEITNNSNREYPEQTQIIYNDKNSTLKPTNNIIKINALAPNITQNITLVYENLKSKEPGYYYSFFNFEINGNIIDDIKINIKILSNNDFELVENFKNAINIYSFKSDNNEIINALKKNRYNFEKTFSYLLEKEDKK